CRFCAFASRLDGQSITAPSSAPVPIAITVSITPLISFTSTGLKQSGLRFPIFPPYSPYSPPPIKYPHPLPLQLMKPLVKNECLSLSHLPRRNIFTKADLLSG
ncbi:hypothetical protein L249_3064, partial [Ophiocordyceps polyrhachis-furcata BCC 54312]